MPDKEVFETPSTDGGLVEATLSLPSSFSSSSANTLSLALIVVAPVVDANHSVHTPLLVVRGKLSAHITSRSFFSHLYPLHLFLFITLPPAKSLL